MPRAPLPYEQVEQLWAQLTNASAPQRPALACSTRPLLSVVAAPADARRAASISAAAYRPLEAALRWLHPLLDPDLTTATLLYPPSLPTPGGEGRESTWAGATVAVAAAAAGDRDALAAWAAQLRQLAWQTKQAHLPALPAASLLWYLPAGAEVAAAAGQGSSLVLADGTLLLVAGGRGGPVEQGVWGEEEAWGQEKRREGQEGGLQQPPLQQEQQQLADVAVGWLLGALGAAGAAPAEQAAAARRLARGCAAEAVALLRGFLAAAEALPEMPVPPDLAALAGEAARHAAVALALAAGAGGGAVGAAAGAAGGGGGSGEPWAALAAARAAWEVAAAAARHPGFGTRPHFPPEHTLAVLLPLGLPVTLVLVQAALREVQAWRRQRRGQGAQQQQREEEGQGAGCEAAKEQQLLGEAQEEEEGVQEGEQQQRQDRQLKQTAAQQDHHRGQQPQDGAEQPQGEAPGGAAGS